LRGGGEGGSEWRFESSREGGEGARGEACATFVLEAEGIEGLRDFRGEVSLVNKDLFFGEVVEVFLGDDSAAVVVDVVPVSTLRRARAFIAGTFVIATFSSQTVESSSTTVDADFVRVGFDRRELAFL
jgi:hypothetical protein